MSLAFGTLALLVVVLIFWQFCIGFARGLRSADPNGSLPRQTHTAPGLQSATPPGMLAATDHAQPVVVMPLDQAANETYVLPHITKGGPYIDSDTVMSIQRAAEALDTHTDLGVKLDTPAQWHFLASVLWSDSSTLSQLSRSGPPAQRARYGKWAKDLAHLCHLVRSEPSDPALQHYYVKIIYATDSQAR